MPLIKCPECGKEVSNKAHACPHCGFPIEEVAKKEDVLKIREFKIEKMKDEDY